MSEIQFVSEIKLSVASFLRSFAPPKGPLLPARRGENLGRKVQRSPSYNPVKRRNLNQIDDTDNYQPCEDSARILLAIVRKLLPAPWEITSMAVR